MSAPEAERLARVALCLAFEPADARIARMVSSQGAVRTCSELLRRGSVDGGHKEAIARLDASDPAFHLDLATRGGLRFVVPGDREWPVQLDDLEHAPEVTGGRGGVPLGLWVRGPRPLDTLGDSVAVVGTRAPTAYGTDVAREISHAVSSRRWAVVSGAAHGIDQAAHRAALAGRGGTVAVLACGADRVYPPRNEALIEHLADQMAVVSEAPPGALPMKVRFLARNRIIAALARGTVVVEAAPRSGALNTAGWSDGISRPVMGVPGPVTSATSGGVHQLLRRGATLVTNGAEVLETCGDAGEHLTFDVRGPEHPRDHLDPHQLQVLEALPAGRPSGLDNIARIAGIDVAETERVLVDLTRHGFAEQTRAGWRITPFGRS